MAKNRRAAVLLAALMLFSAAPTVVQAATVDLTESVKSSLDKTAAQADSKLKSKLLAQYDELAGLQKKDTELDGKIKTLHAKNDEDEKLLRKRIKEIDAAKLSKLETEVKKTKEKYQPLFTAYTSVNQKIETARALKNKDLNALLRLQAEGMKASVQLARVDIKNKEADLKAAKDSANKTIKKIRDILADIDPLQDKIKAEKNASGTPKKSISTVWSSFKQYLKKQDAKGSSDSLGTLISLSRQIADQKQKIYDLEKKISDIIAKAKAQVPASQ